MDFNIDTQKAASWQKEVKQELAEVEMLLKKVGDSIEECPTDDGLSRAIHDVGSKYMTDWNELCRAFDKATDFIGDVINEIRKSLEEGMNNFKSLLR